jgi:hypothetical protein
LIFRKISEEKVSVNGPKGLRYITKFEASVTQLMNRAAKGDLKAIHEVIRYAQIFGDTARSMVQPIFNIRFREAENGDPTDVVEDENDQN